MSFCCLQLNIDGVDTEGVKLSKRFADQRGTEVQGVNLLCSHCYEQQDVGNNQESNT